MKTFFQKMPDVFIVSPPSLGPHWWMPRRPLSNLQPAMVPSHPLTLLWKHKGPSKGINPRPSVQLPPQTHTVTSLRSCHLSRALPQNHTPNCHSSEPPTSAHFPGWREIQVTCIMVLATSVLSLKVLGVLRDYKYTVLWGKKYILQKLFFVNCKTSCYSKRIQPH